MFKLNSSMIKAIYSPFALIGLIILSACGGNSSRFAIHGESYCDEVNQIVKIASQHHLSTSEKDLERLYSQSMDQTWDVLTTATVSHDHLVGVTERALSQQRGLSAFSFEDLSNCKDFKKLEAVFQYDGKTVFHDERTPYWVFLSKFADSLDYFSSYSPPKASSSNESEEQVYHYGIKLDLNLAIYFAHIQTEAPVLAISDSNSEIKVGDKILAVETDETLWDLTSIEDLSKMNRAKDVQMSSIDQLFDFSKRESITVEYMKKNDASQKIHRTQLIGKPLKGMHFFETPAVAVEVEDRILFIRIFSFAQNSYSQLVSKISELDEEAREFESIVLDLRFNPGGSFQEALRIASLFLPETKVGSIIRRAEPPAESTDGSEDFDMEFDFEYSGIRYKQDPVAISPIGKIYTQPMIVLANEASASSADILTQILSENNRAYFVGTRTFGKGIGQVSESLGPISKLGGQFKMTMMQFVGPSGSSAQFHGVDPNYELPDPLIEQLIEECKSDKSLPCLPTKMSEISTEKIILPIPAQVEYCEPIPHGIQTHIPIHKYSSLEIGLKTRQSSVSPHESFDFQKEAAKELLRLR